MQDVEYTEVDLIVFKYNFYIPSSDRKIQGELVEDILCECN